MPYPESREIVPERTVTGRAGKTFPETFSLYQGDRQMLLQLMQLWGCSKSEAFRTCVRMAHAFAMGNEPTL